MGLAASILPGDWSLSAVDRPRRRSFARTLVSLHERVMSRPTLELARQLDESQWWPANRHVERQGGALRSLLSHAIENCPFYSAHRPRALDEFPLLSRETLRLHHEQMKSSRATAPLLGHTHGSADEPVRFYWDRLRQACDKAHRLRGHSWHGLQIGDRELHFWPIDPPPSLTARGKQVLRSLRDALTKERQLNMLELRAASERKIRRWQRQWMQFDPARISAYPSALTEFAQRVAGYEMRNPALRAIALTGEVAFAWQRQLIEAAFGAAIVQSYGLQEVGPIAFECERGSWHICSESVIVEFIRHGRPARPGQLAEVVVTGLQSHTMPMIRYCTGDIVRVFQPRDCSCGRGLPVMPGILGRAGDFLVAEDGRWVCPEETIGRLGQVIAPSRFQVFQDATGDVAVCIIDAAGDDADRQARIQTALRDLLGPAVRCRINRATALSQTRFGKCRYVQSARTTGGLAIVPQGEAAALGI